MPAGGPPHSFSGAAAHFSTMSCNICRSFSFITMWSLCGNRCEEEAHPSKMYQNLWYMTHAYQGQPFESVISTPIKSTQSSVIALHIACNLILCPSCTRFGWDGCFPCPHSTLTYGLFQRLLLPQNLPGREYPLPCCPMVSRDVRCSPRMYEGECCQSLGLL